MKENGYSIKKCWGGKRECAGRKKTCRNKVPFNRRINEDGTYSGLEYYSKSR